MTTVAVAVVATFVRPARQRIKGHPVKFSRNQVVYDSLSALSIVPFLLIMLSAFNKSLLAEAVASSGPMMALGGFWGAVFVVSDLWAIPALPPKD